MDTPEYCLVPGCGVPLDSLSIYHRRHKVCPAHLKQGAVTIAGAKHRFCQQCGRFQPLSDFNGDRRSCRVALRLHNSRRRVTVTKDDDDYAGEQVLLPSKRSLSSSNKTLRCSKRSVTRSDPSPQASSSESYHCGREQAQVQHASPQSHAPGSDGACSTWTEEQVGPHPESPAASSLRTAACQQPLLHWSTTVQSRQEHALRACSTTLEKGDTPWAMLAAAQFPSPLVAAAATCDSSMVLAGLLQNHCGSRISGERGSSVLTAAACSTGPTLPQGHEWQQAFMGGHASAAAAAQEAVLPQHCWSSPAQQQQPSGFRVARAGTQQQWQLAPHVRHQGTGQLGVLPSTGPPSAAPASCAVAPAGSTPQASSPPDQQDSMALLNLLLSEADSALLLSVTDPAAPSLTGKHSTSTTPSLQATAAAPAAGFAANMSAIAAAKAAAGAAHDGITVTRLCPEVQGPAVHRARGLAKLPMNDDDAFLCEAFDALIKADPFTMLAVCGFDARSASQTAQGA